MQKDRRYFHLLRAATERLDLKFQRLLTGTHQANTYCVSRQRLETATTDVPTATLNGPSTNMETYCENFDVSANYSADVDIDHSELTNGDQSDLMDGDHSELIDSERFELTDTDHSEEKLHLKQFSLTVTFFAEKQGTAVQQPPL